MRRKKDLLKQISLFQVYSSIFFLQIFRDYSRRNLPLLLQILLSHPSLFRNSKDLNMKVDFFQLRRQINQTITNFHSYFKHVTRSKCRKNTSQACQLLKTEISITKITRPFHTACSKCPPFALMQARRHLQKLGIDFLIASCCSSSHIIRNPIFSCSLVAD